MKKQQEFVIFVKNNRNVETRMQARFEFYIFFAVI